MLYDVNVTRISTATLTLRVEADSPEEAQEKAVEEAHDTDFTGCTVEYDFETGTATAASEQDTPNVHNMTGDSDCDGEASCPDSPDRRHHPDPASLKPADGAGRNRGTDWIVDATCLHCGRSGSTRIAPEDIEF